MQIVDSMIKCTWIMTNYIVYIVRIFPITEAFEAPNDKTIVAIILYYLDGGSMCPS